MSAADFVGGVSELNRASEENVGVRGRSARGRRSGTSAWTSDGDHGGYRRWIHRELPAPLLIPCEVQGMKENKIEVDRTRNEALWREKVLAKA